MQALTIRRTPLASYWPRRVSASRMGALEILIAPSNGLFSSSRRKIDPETDSAQTINAARTVALRGATTWATP